MGAPAAEMAPSSSSTPTQANATSAVAAPPPFRASPQDLCVDCFRGNEQLVTALLDHRLLAKGRTATAGALTITGWHAPEPVERRRGSIGSSEETGGERKRRPGFGWPAEEVAEPFQHHLDTEAYIREYRRQREASMEAALRKSRKKENDVGGR